MVKRVELKLAKIVDRLHWGGKLTRQELNAIKLRLVSPQVCDDVHDLALAFSMGVKPYQNNLRLLERLLYKDIDDYELSAVLKALCINWHRAHKYKDYMLNLCHPRRFLRNFEAAKTAFLIFEKNIHKPNFTDVFETLYWRWQETLEPQEKPINANYARAINRIMEVALLGDKVLEPMYIRTGKTPVPEWNEELGNILEARKAKNNKNIFKLTIFDNIFARA